MGFIRNALVGIALYEAVKYLMKKEEFGFSFATDEPTASSSGRAPAPIHSVGSSNEATKRAAERVTEPVSSHDLEVDLELGSNPDVLLTGQDSTKTDDPWKKSLADETLRAPDS